MKYVIGCDIGSQSLKVILISEQGKPCGEASRGYPIDYPQPAWAEQSPNLWLEALEQAVRLLIATTGISSRDVLALGLDAQVDGIVAVDEGGEPLYPAMIWMDRRAVSQCELAGRQISQEAVFQITGWPTTIRPCLEKQLTFCCRVVTLPSP
jgi:xylulokinase